MWGALPWCRQGWCLMVPVHPFAFPDQQPCLISEESHADGIKQLSPNRKKEFGIPPRSTLWPSHHPLDPLFKTRIKKNQRKNNLTTCEECVKWFAQVETTAFGLEAFLWASCSSCDCNADLYLCFVTFFSLPLFCFNQFLFAVAELHFWVTFFFSILTRF